MGKGGYRPGAGRKKGLASIQAEKSREFLVQEIVKDMGPIIQGLKEAAIGIYTEKEITEDGQVKKIVVYKEKPKYDVAEYLVNQVIGRPKESVALEGEVTATFYASLSTEEIEARIRRIIDGVGEEKGSRRPDVFDRGDPEVSEGRESS